MFGEMDGAILLDDVNKVVGAPEAAQGEIVRDLYARKSRYMLDEYAREANRKQDAVATLAILKSRIDTVKEGLDEIKAYNADIMARLQEDLEDQERKELENLFIDWHRLTECNAIMNGERATPYLFK